MATTTNPAKQTMTIGATPITSQRGDVTVLANRIVFYSRVANKRGGSSAQPVVTSTPSEDVAAFDRFPAAGDIFLI